MARLANMHDVPFLASLSWPERHWAEYLCTANCRALVSANGACAWEFRGTHIRIWGMWGSGAPDMLGWLQACGAPLFVECGLGEASAYGACGFKALRSSKDGVLMCWRKA